ncbi:MAG: hypothetical protein FWG64_01385 [Firmicutes bacterium]|nr:hypothetical protein [Bacillota bacterium]
MKTIKSKKLCLTSCILAVAFMSACAVQAAEDVLPVVESVEVATAEVESVESYATNFDEIANFTDFTEETAETLQQAEPNEVVILYDRTPRNPAQWNRDMRSDPLRPANEEELLWILSAWEEQLERAIEAENYEMIEIVQQEINFILENPESITFPESFDLHERPQPAFPQPPRSEWPSASRTINGRGGTQETP